MFYQPLPLLYYKTKQEVFFGHSLKNFLTVLWDCNNAALRFWVYIEKLHCTSQNFQSFGRYHKFFLYTPKIISIHCKILK